MASRKRCLNADLVGLGTEFGENVGTDEGPLFVLCWGCVGSKLGLCWFYVGAGLFGWLSWLGEPLGGSWGNPAGPPAATAIKMLYKKNPLEIPKGIPS